MTRPSSPHPSLLSISESSSLLSPISASSSPLAIAKSILSIADPDLAILAQYPLLDDDDDDIAVASPSALALGDLPSLDDIPTTTIRRDTFPSSISLTTAE